MKLTDKEIEALALEKYPIEKCITGGCAGIKESDKYAFERKIWIEGFKAAIAYCK